MAKVVKPHQKTIIYIVPAGQQTIPSETVECICTETKGADHVSAMYRKEENG